MASVQGASNYLPRAHPYGQLVYRRALEVDFYGRGRCGPAGSLGTWSMCVKHCSKGHSHINFNAGLE